MQTEPNSRRTTVVATMALALGSISCSDGGDPMTPRWAGTLDTISGVEIVMNPETPLLDAADRPEAREVWRTTDTGAEGYWASPNRIAVGHGLVYVLDPGAAYVYSVDRQTGEGVGTMGGEGDGPGELQRPFDIGVLGDRVLIGNSGGPRIDLFSSDGSYDRSLRIDFLPFGMEVTGDGRLMLTGLEQGSGITRLLDLDGKTTPYEAPDSSLVVAELDYDSCPRWGTGPSGLFRAYCRLLAFQQLSAVDGLTREVRVAGSPVRATDAELRYMEQQLREMVAETNLSAAEADRFINGRLEEARVKAVYAGIRGDPVTHRIYVLEQTPEVLGGGHASLNVFDRGGRYLARISFDSRWRDFRVVDDRVLALTEDPDLGIVSLVAYDLTWPDVRTAS